MRSLSLESSHSLLLIVVSLSSFVTPLLAAATQHARLGTLEAIVQGFLSPVA